MPTYEYRCKACENELEAVQGFHDDPLTECPACGGPLRKKFGSVGISFKGSGFYKNDSRSTAASSDKSSSESGSSDSGSDSSDTVGSGTSDTTSSDKKAPDKTGSDKVSSDTTSTTKASGSSSDSGSKSKTPAAT
jgi:putative FmdB family regulatory protein